MMEVEREKKEKLAAARKKLNEYKLSRSGGTTGRSNPVNTTPSQPADVPLFYQNLNSPASSVNIFNPAAVNNNAMSSPSIVPPGGPPVVTTTSSLFAGETSNGTTEPAAVHQNTNFLPNQQQFHPSPPSSINQPENVAQFNPFSSPTSATQNVEESFGFYGSGDKETVNSNSQNMTSPVFSPVNTVLDSEGRPVEHGVIPGAVPETTSNLSQGNDGLSFNPSNAEFSPSAPIFDSSSVSENLEQLTMPTISPVEDSMNQNLSTENHSNMFPNPIPSTDIGIMSNEAIGEVIQTHITSTQAATIPVFASSLFGSTSSEADSIFNVEDKTSLISPTAAPSHTENSSTAENISDLNPFTSPESGPEERTSSSFETQNSLTETVNDLNYGQSYEGLANRSNEEATLESDAQNTATSETHLYSQSPDTEVTQRENYHTLVSPFSNEQLLSTTNELSETLQHEEELLVQNDVPNDFNDASHESIQQMRSVQEALELQIEELRRENTHLLGRQTELTTRIEESERLAHEFKLEKDRVREESTTTSQALRARINSLFEENQRIVKNSTDIGVDLRAKLEEKSRQLEEMQKAVIIVSQSKMDFAGKLDHELERVKELQSLLKERDDEIASLRTENGELQEKLKQDQQRDAVIHQLQDQTRHYQVHCETLQRELATARSKFKNQQVSSPPSGHHHDSDDNHSHDAPSGTDTTNGCTNECEHQNGHTSSQNTENHHHHSDESKTQNHEGPSLDPHGHYIDNQQHGHENEKNADIHNHDCSSHDLSGHHHHHDHGHDHHHHDHEKDSHGDHHHHDHGESHDHHHHHGDDHHHHSHDSSENVVARRGPSDEMTELKKTLHRLEWENSSFRSEIDVLAIDAKQKRTYEEKCDALQEENHRLRKEVEQLEHVIIQLQGENDTIGDYITLYQTQKMALKECAKEKDAQLELLAREREMLLHRLTELTALVKDLKDNKSEAGSQCADDHMHTLDHPAIHSPPNNKRQIEGKIRDLLTEISSSSLIENFHPCAVCSGRLMTV